MVSHSVSCYHAHFRIQDREEGNETVGFLLRVLVVAFGNFFFCPWNKRWMNAGSREFEIDLKDYENDVFG